MFSSRPFAFRLRICAAMLLPLGLLAACGRGPGPRSIPLNGPWNFQYVAPGATGAAGFEQPAFDDSAWKTIPVPANWNMLGYGRSIYKSPEDSQGLYRLRTTIPASWKGQHVALRFEGVMYAYELFVNGARAGAWDSAFNPCQFDITAHVKFGESNTLAVRVLNRSKTYEFDTNDDWSYSGIFRDVTLLRVPPVHIADQKIVTHSVPGRDSWEVEVATVLGRFETGTVPSEARGLSPLESCTLSGELRDASGRRVGSFERPLAAIPASRDRWELAIALQVKNPRLWTAETPNLYQLTTRLKQGRKVLHERAERIGLREVAIRGGVFTVNGRPVKLHGVCRHESDPILGKALGEEEMLRDVRLMKAANINFVRTSHYPPHPRFIELCDERGIYVDCEVPFGFGDKHLTDPAYQEDLYRRADATVGRDKNHPSIIFWTVGNENPWTTLVENTLARVRRIDPTRPASVALKGSDVAKYGAEIARATDLICGHYPEPGTLEKWAAQFPGHAIVATEFSHTLGLSIEELAPVWAVMEKFPNLAGGAVWDWCDQGILVAAGDKKPGPHPDETWPDAEHYYDCSESNGTDGIVYPDRRPQTDYWQVRKVFAPVVLEGRELSVTSGSREVTLTLRNRYDFLDFKDAGLRYAWTLWEDTRRIGSGGGRLELGPHKSQALTIDLGRHLNPGPADRRFEIRFTNKQGEQVTERTLRLLVDGGRPDLKARLVSAPARLPVGFKVTPDGTERLTAGPIVVERNRATGQLAVKAPGGAPVLIGGPWARVGRRPSLAERMSAQRNPKEATYWEPWILTSVKVEDIVAERGGKGVVLRQRVRYERPGGKGEAIAGVIGATISPQGWIDVAYVLKPVNASGVLLEAGISFALAPGLNQVRWLGEGPYPGYPSQDALNERGIYHLDARDLNFGGNRPRTDLAAFTDAAGLGLGILCEGADLAWERAEGGGLIISHNALVAGRGNKGKVSATRLPAAKVERIAGSFRLVPLTAETWPKLFADFFGPPRPAPLAIDAPYLASYDTQ